MSQHPGPQRSWLARSLSWLRRRPTRTPHRPLPDPGQLQLPVHLLTPGRYEPTEAERRLRTQDEWFFNHCVVAAQLVAQALALPAPRASRVLDIGCGDGIMALGVARASGAEVIGCDVTRAFDTLPERASALLGSAAWPDTLRFVQSVVNQPLPFDDATFDAAYSWSVFEHVDTVPQLLAEVHRVLKPGASFFLQIEPLYYSPHGSHLRRLLDEPWAHLLADEDTYLQRIAQARDQVSEQEKDMLYRSNEFEAVKRYLMGEYRSLNKVRTHELVEHAQSVGFQVDRCELGQVTLANVPAELLARFSAHDLRTNEIRLWLRRT